MCLTHSICYAKLTPKVATPKPRQSFTLKPLSAKPRQKHTNIARRKHPTVNYQTSPMSHATKYSQTISNGSNPKPRPLSNHAKTTSIFHAKTTLKPRQNHVNLARQKEPQNHSKSIPFSHATTTLKPFPNGSNPPRNNHSQTTPKPRQSSTPKPLLNHAKKTPISHAKNTPNQCLKGSNLARHNHFQTIPNGSNPPRNNHSQTTPKPRQNSTPKPLSKYTKNIPISHAKRTINQLPNGSNVAGYNHSQTDTIHHAKTTPKRRPVTNTQQNVSIQILSHPGV